MNQQLTGKHVFIYDNLEDAINVGCVIRNVTTFRQIFLYNVMHCEGFTHKAMEISRKLKYPDNPSDFVYVIDTLENTLKELRKQNYSIVIVETEDWRPDLDRISDWQVTDIKCPTAFILGRESRGLPKTLQWKANDCKVLTFGTHSQNVAHIGVRVETLLNVGESLRNQLSNK